MVGKGKKCWFPSFSPFPTMFSEGSLYRVIKSLDCVVWSEHLTACQKSIFVGIESICSNLTLSQTSPGFHVSAVQVF